MVFVEAANSSNMLLAAKFRAGKLRAGVESSASGEWSQEANAPSARFGTARAFKVAKAF